MTLRRSGLSFESLLRNTGGAFRKGVLSRWLGSRLTDRKGGGSEMWLCDRFFLFLSLFPLLSEAMMGSLVSLKLWGVCKCGES